MNVHSSTYPRPTCPACDGSSKEVFLKGKLALATACCVLVLCGCAEQRATVPGQTQSTPPSAYRESILERADLREDEKAALALALDDLEQYLLERSGASKLKEFKELATQSSDLYECLKKTYGANPVFLLQDYGRRPSLRGQKVRPEWMTSLSNHLVFQYHPGSSAERDIEVIKREAESALSGACTELGYTREQLEAKLDSLVEMRDSVSGQFYVKGGKWEFTYGRIPVILTEDFEEYRTLGGPKYSTGVSGIGLVEAKALGGPVYSARVIFRYRDVLNLMALNHELVHSVHFLAPAATPAAFSSYLARESQRGAEEFTSRDFELAHGVNNGSYLREGLATWYQVRYGLVPKALKVPAARRMAADLLLAGNDFDLEKIIRWNLSLNLFEKALTLLGKEKYVMREGAILYVGAACFIEYILAQFGPDKLHLLMACTEGDASHRITRVFGMDVQHMDQQWRDWIRAGSSQFPMHNTVRREQVMKRRSGDPSSRAPDGRRVCADGG